MVACADVLLDASPSSAILHPVKQIGAPMKRRAFYLSVPKSWQRKAGTLLNSPRDWKEAVRKDVSFYANFQVICAPNGVMSTTSFVLIGAKLAICCGLHSNRPDVAVVSDVFAKSSMPPQSGQELSVQGDWLIVEEEIPAAIRDDIRLWSAGRNIESPNLPVDALVVEGSCELGSNEKQVMRGGDVPEDGATLPPSPEPVVNSEIDVDSTQLSANRTKWRTAILEEKAATSEIFQGILNTPDPVATLAQAVESIENSIRLLNSQIKLLEQKRLSLPSMADTEAMFKDADYVAELANTACVEIPPWRLCGPGFEDLRMVLMALSTRDWNFLPPWLFDKDPISPAGRQHIIDDEGRVYEILACLHWMGTTFPNGVPESLRKVERVETGRPVERLKIAWENSQERHLLFLKIGAVLANADTYSLDELRKINNHLESWRAVLHPDAVRELIDQLKNVQPADWLHVTFFPEQTKELPENLLNVLKTNPSFASAKVTLDAFLSMLPKQSAPVLAGATPTLPLVSKEVTSQIKQISPPLTNEGGKIMHPVILAPTINDATQMGILRIPVRFQASDRLTGFIRVVVQVEHLLHMGQMEIDSNTKVVGSTGQRYLDWNIPCDVEDWARKETEDWLFETILNLPSLSAAIKQYVDGKELKVTFNFNKITRNSTFKVEYPGLPVTFGTADAITPMEMLQAPLGIQTLHARLTQTVCEGRKSFIISAPRRFGKSTLLNYIYGKATALKEPNLFVVRVRLLHNSRPQEAMRRVLDEIESSIKKNLKYALEPITTDSQGFPLASGFLDLRSVLRKNRYHSLILFIDEAQTLVPIHDGQTWGHMFKDLIEEIGIQTESLANVAWILFGTPALADRLPDNCRNFLTAGGKVTRLSAETLGTFLRVRAGDRLLSSAIAREELATQAGNVWLLLRLAEQIALLVSNDNRTFFLRSDVQQAKLALLKREEESEGELWSYAKDELSHSDQWNPIDAYPVAMALSVIDADSPTERRNQCILWLNQQLSQIQIQAKVVPERVDQCLDDLSRLEVIRKKDATFHRPILAELLRIRVHNNPFSEDVDQQALLRLAIDQVHMPKTVTDHLEGKGGQASVYYHTAEGRREAWRCAHLTDMADRRRFIQTCAALRALRQGPSRLVGDEFLPKVRHAGFNIADADQGIIVYDWIDGQPFQKIWEQTGDIARAYVVRQVALGLSALDNHGVVHRDVTPRNVLVDGSLKATLIDFGMACLTDTSGDTVIEDTKFVSPEVSERREYSSASDIYALGAILRGDERKEVTHVGIGNLVQKMKLPKASNRPSAIEVADTIAKILEDSGFNAERHKKKNELFQKIEGPPWLRQRLLEESFFGIALQRLCKHTHWTEGRALEAAHFLNTIFVDWLRQPEADPTLKNLPWSENRPSLARLSQFSLPSPWQANSLRAVGALRNAYAHPEGKHEILRELLERNRITESVRLSTYRKWLDEVSFILASAAKAPIIHVFTQIMTQS